MGSLEENKGTDTEIGEAAKRIIREIRELKTGYPDNTYPIMYALAFLMVENGATSRMNLDGMTRTVKQIMDRIQKENDIPRNRPTHGSSRESNPYPVQKP